MGMKSQDTAELYFENVRVPAANLLGGAEGQGFYQLMGDLPYERALIAVVAVAAMENEYLVCRMFADSRVQRIYGGTNEIMKELISRAL
jgi:acyl-CoA dehydrogenase